MTQHHQMLEHKIYQHYWIFFVLHIRALEHTEGCDEWAGDAVHDHHGEHQQHPGILLTKPGRSG